MFYGRIEALIATRQAALDAAYAAHAERFVRGPPQAGRPPTVVEINPLAPDARLLPGVHFLPGEAESPGTLPIAAIAT
ncbi:MAG: hypothetical protein ACREA0_27595 [bacterium]